MLALLTSLVQRSMSSLMVASNWSGVMGLGSRPKADSEDANEPPSLSAERTRVQFLVTDSNRRPQIDKIEAWICWFSMGND